MSIDPVSHPSHVSPAWAHGRLNGQTLEKYEDIEQTVPQKNTITILLLLCHPPKSFYLHREKTEN
jgi:hypothetical protein